jgi:CRISPR-associated protein Cas2
MTVLVVERASPGLRGLITRWMIQPHTGVFVGVVSARVRERLWAEVQRKLKSGGAVLVWANRTAPQGYRALVAGRTRRALEDFDGLKLPWKPI